MHIYISPEIITITLTCIAAYYLIGVVLMMTFGIVFAFDQREYPKTYKKRLARALTKPFLFAPLWPLAIKEELQEFRKALQRRKQP